MKKLITIVLILAMLLPAAAFSEEEKEYSPKLGMTAEEFIQKYNAIPSALGSPFVPLTDPDLWLAFGNQYYGTVFPVSLSGVSVEMFSLDQQNARSMKCGLDKITIYGKPDQWIELISVAKRCISLFSTELLGVQTSSFAITEAISYYFENNLEGKSYYAYRILDTDEKFALAFGKNFNQYYFAIVSREDIK